MPCTNSQVKITTFINPHLFWIFERDNVSKRDGLESKLGNALHTIVPTPQLGQFVLIRNDSCYKRAIVKDISPPDKYYCWLIDYGVLYNADKVFKMPNGMSKIPAMTKKAALDNTVGVEEVLGPIEKTLVESLHFTPGTIHCAKTRIKSATAIFFHCLRDYKDIHIGEITIRGPNDDQYNLSTLLLKEKLLAFNTTMFAQALDMNSNADNENYLKFTRTVSPQCSSGVDSGSRDDSIFSLTGKSVGRAKSRHSWPLEANLESRQNKHNDLQKWVEESKTTNVSIVEEYELDDSKMDVKLDSSGNASKINTDDSIEPSDSVSAVVKLSPSHLDRLRELRNRQKLGKTTTTTNSSLSSGQVFLDKTTDQSTDTSINVTIDNSDTGSFSSFETAADSKKDVTMFGSSSSPSSVKEHNSSLTSNTESKKVQSWGDFENDTSQKHAAKPSVTSLLNIQPAGVSYTSTASTKRRSPARKYNTGGRSKQNSTLSSSSSSISLSKDVDISDSVGKDIIDVLHSMDPKIVCLCNDCKKYTDDTIVNQKVEPIMQPPKKLIKPPLLLKAEDDTDEVVVKTFQSEMKYRAQIMADPNVVVHGTIFPKPINSIAEVPFDAAIHRFLRVFEQVYSIQSFTWPCLLRKMNVCVVNGPKSGKTMSYLPVMCTNLLERNDRYSELPTNTVSPLVIILCPGTLVADEVYDLTDKIMDDVPNRPMVALAVPPQDRACLNQFRKQCDLLITTPMMLVQLLNSIITSKRVCHLVLEQADVLLEKFPDEMTKLFNQMNAMLMKRNCNYSIQVVAVSERWTIPLENLMKKLQYTPFVCIGAHLEAALYGRADIQMQFLEFQNKKLTLCDLVKNSYETCRTIVVCANEDDINELREILELKGIKGTFLSNAMEKVEIEETEMKWLATVGGKHFVLVCTDEIYNTILRITNAVILIHYTLPTTWTQFSNRFSCFIKNYQSPLAKKQDGIRCKAHVFLDETCGKQFPKLIQLLTRMGCQFSTQFDDYYKASIKAKEDCHILAQIPICSKLKLFGKCSNLKCRSRHILSNDLDYNNDLPKNGTIKFKILRIRNVTSFTIKLLEHTDMNGNTSNCVKYPHLHKDLQKTMQQEKTSVYDACLNEKYVYQSRVDRVFYRCVVKKILRQERITKTATVVIVRLIDAGFDSKVGVADLYVMPEEFRDIPSEGVEVFLANLLPPDSDEHFSTYSKNVVTSWIDRALDDGKPYCSGYILLQLGNTLWIKNMYIMEHLSSLNTTATRLNLSKDLLKQKMADKSDLQLTTLYKLCNEAGIELPNFNKPTLTKDATCMQVKPQWAFLEEAVYSEVYMITVQTPSLFYVRIKKFHDLLLELEEQIQKAVLKPFYPTDFEVCTGQYYLAKDPGGDNFCRVEVTDISDGIANCFYVDYGDEGSVDVADIKFLSNELIEKLPFQAIECRLYGVQPLFDNWETDPIDILDRFIFEPESDYFRTLYATVCIKEASSRTGNQKYSILLIDTFTKKHTVINKLLIDCGEALNIEIENIDIEFERAEQCMNGTDESKYDEISEEVENKELSFEDVDRLRSKYGAPNNEEPQSELDNTWDFELNDKELFLKNLLGVANTTSQLNGDTSLPPMRALPPPGYSTPHVEWFQNETHIKLTILLPNIKTYNLRLLRNASLIFMTNHNETEYKFHLHLLDKVDMGQEVLTGLCLRVTLVKCQPYMWSRLTIGKERLRFLKYDLNYCAEPEQPKKPILSLGQVLEEGDALPGDNIMQYGSDDENSSDDYSVCTDDF